MFIFSHLRKAAKTAHLCLGIGLLLVGAFSIFPHLAFATGLQVAPRSSAVILPVAGKSPIKNGYSIPLTVSTTAVAVKTPVKTVHRATVSVAPKAVVAAPQARLKIPKIKVDAVIKDMGLTPAGAMAVPGNTVDVGWYKLGTRPGENGSAVIGGHNRWDNGMPAVFLHLDQLQKGDIVSVVNALGVTTSFTVREMRTYDPTDVAPEVFFSEDGAHLNLITCSGVWNPATKTYTKRLVIFTDAIK